MHLGKGTCDFLSHWDHENDERIEVTLVDCGSSLQQLLLHNLTTTTQDNTGDSQFCTIA